MKILHGADEILPYVGPILGIETRRQLYYELEKECVPGAWRKGPRDQWHLSVAAFQRGMAERFGLPIEDTTRSPDERMAAQLAEQEESA